MPDISKWNIHGTQYDIADAAAREDIEDLQDDVGELQSAVDDKLDTPATAGTAGQVLGLDSNLSPVWVNQSGSVDPADIATAVDAWCDENITNPDSPPLDRSLTASSAAAPADIVGDIAAEYVSTNLYDKNACNPADGYMYNKSGVYAQSSSYACSGKIPVSGSTQYIFGAGNATVHTVRYFSGDSGGTYIDGETISGASFTTPANCTFIAINLFAVNHSTDDYNSAINVAQLNTGSTLKPYEPFGNKYYVPMRAIEDSGKLESIFTDVHGKNLYDKMACNPQNGKQYTSSGAVRDSAYYAITGIIPCGGDNVYTFSAGGALAQYAVYFSGNTFISRERIDGASFKTPANCDGVGFNLFATQHSAEEYAAAINTAQLEAGDRATEYEAYSSQTTPGYSFIEQGIGGNVGKTVSQKAITELLAYPKRTTWWYGRKGDSLGDSITYKFSNFQKFVKAYLGLAEFYNNGMTGTKMAGPADPTWGDSMWMDSRINALHEDAEFVTILGGANDSALEEIGEISIDNCDTDTYAGAFNVILSKIYYRYNALSGGRYSDIDYSGVTKLNEPHNILIIPCTQFYFPGGLANGKQKADAIRALSELWGLKVCDFWGWSQANPGVADVYWTQSDTVHPTALFYKERLAPLLISSLKWLQPIDFDDVE